MMIGQDLGNRIGMHSEAEDGWNTDPNDLSYYTDVPEPPDGVTIKESAG